MRAALEQRGLPPGRPGDGAALPTFVREVTDTRTRVPAGTVVDKNEINVTINGASGEVESIRANTVAGVKEALHKIGLLQSGDTLQIGGL
jgi:hypothetical protein